MFNFIIDKNQNYSLLIEKKTRLKFKRIIYAKKNFKIITLRKKKIKLVVNDDFNLELCEKKNDY